MSSRSEELAVPVAAGYSWRARRPAVLFGAGFVALLVAVVLGVGLGTVAVAPGDTLAIHPDAVLPPPAAVASGQP